MDSNTSQLRSSQLKKNIRKRSNIRNILRRRISQQTQKNAKIFNLYKV